MKYFAYSLVLLFLSISVSANEIFDETRYFYLGCKKRNVFSVIKYKFTAKQYNQYMTDKGYISCMFTTRRADSTTTYWLDLFGRNSEETESWYSFNDHFVISDLVEYDDGIHEHGEPLEESIPYYHAGFNINYFDKCFAMSSTYYRNNFYPNNKSIAPYYKDIQLRKVSDLLKQKSYVRWGDFKCQYGRYN